MKILRQQMQSQYEAYTDHQLRNALELNLLRAFPVTRQLPTPIMILLEEVEKRLVKGEKA